MIGVGIIGAGAIAKKAHLPAYKKLSNVKLIAIADIDKKGAEKIAKKFNVKKVYSDYKKLLERDDIDFVSICTPNFLHAPMTIEALKHGKHVFLEKPLATTLEDAEKIVETSEKTGKYVCVARNFRFVSSIQKAIHHVKTGRFGRLITAKLTFHSEIPFGWTFSTWFYDEKLSGGGILTDLGEHCIDIMLQIGGDVTKVSAMGGDILGTMDFETSVVATLEFKTGSIGIIDMSWLGASYQQTLDIFGSGKTVHIDIWADSHFEYTMKPSIFTIISSSIKKSAKIFLNSMNGYIFNPLPTLHNRQISQILTNITSNKKPPGEVHEALKVFKIKEKIQNQLPKKASN